MMTPRKMRAKARALRKQAQRTGAVLAPEVAIVRECPKEPHRCIVDGVGELMHWTDSVSGAQCMMNVAQFAELEAWAANEQQHPR